MLGFDRILDLLPIHTKGRIGEHVVKLVGVELVITQGVAQFDAADVLALDEHVPLADGVALGVQLLAKGAHHRARIQLVHVLHAAGKKSASARRGVVDGADDAVVAQSFVILHEHEGGRQAHDVGGG